MSAERAAHLRPVPAGSAAASDDDVLLAVARGDRDAFAELYDRFSPRIFGIVRKVVRDPSRSEEVTQDVFGEIWRTATRFDPEKGAAKTWMLTMAHRRAIDCVRSAQASRNRDERVGHRDRVRAFDEVAEQVETSIEHEHVREALDDLTDLQREAIELAYFGGRTYREVAELLDTPLGTIKTRMRDGMIRLRDSLTHVVAPGGVA